MTIYLHFNTAGTIRAMFSREFRVCLSTPVKLYNVDAVRDLGGAAVRIHNSYCGEPREYTNVARVTCEIDQDFGTEESE